MTDPGSEVLEGALEAMETQAQTERDCHDVMLTRVRDFHVIQLTRVHANTIERFENTVERREGQGPRYVRSRRHHEHV